jgi:hypothetical protein
MIFPGSRVQFTSPEGATLAQPIRETGGLMTDRTRGLVLGQEYRVAFVARNEQETQLFLEGLREPYPAGLFERVPGEALAQGTPRRGKKA